MYLARFGLSVRSKKKEEYDQHGMLMDKFRISCHAKKTEGRALISISLVSG